MSALKKIMNEEIQKYQGRIYYLELNQDIYGNQKTPAIKPADWIENTKCYDHCSFELHHVIKFTNFEKNKNWYIERGLNMCLILIPKIMHQHLENPMYELTDEEFYNKYLIHKYELLFIKSEYDKGNYPAILTKVSNLISFDDVDLSCFADCEQRAENGNDEFSFADPFNASNQVEGVC